METDSWGGSEELWWACALRLREEGIPVRASLIEWDPLHPKVEALKRAGVDVSLRPKKYSISRRGARYLLRRHDSPAAIDVERWLRRDPPGLVMVNHPYGLPALDLLKVLKASGCPYITISHVISDNWWPDDEDAARTRAAVSSAMWTYFVSNANRDLAVQQYGIPADRTAVVRNPYDASCDETVPWPTSDATQQLSLACVGRLEPVSKGQDLLLRALATPAWRARSWRLNLYGAGRKREFIMRTIAELGLQEHVFLRGHQDIRDIWAENHALVLPSRAEGLPIVIVEAMLCGRPVVTTDVAGNIELLTEGVDAFVADAPTVKHVAEALEQLWARRGDLSAMGAAAAQSARRQLSRDPTGDFVGELKRWAAQAETERSERLPGHQPQS